jgi:hypothetical protein
MMVSDAANRQRYLTKADVKSAYTNAWTSRGKRFLKCPDTAQEFDEDGTPMVVELGPPLFGEPEAGWEWHRTMEADLTELGWVPVENKPCMWRLCTKDSDCHHSSSPRHHRRRPWYTHALHMRSWVEFVYWMLKEPNCLMAGVTCTEAMAKAMSLVAFLTCGPSV